MYRLNSVLAFLLLFASASFAQLDTLKIVIGHAGTALPPPVLTVSPSSIAFGAVDSGSTSVSESYIVTGSNLVDSIYIAAPAHFEISTASGTGFTSSLALAPVSGSVNQTIYVRFYPTATPFAIPPAWFAP